MRSNVMIVLKHASDAMTVIGEICGRDGIVHDLDTDHGILDATLDCRHVESLRSLPGVSYIRPVMTFCEVA